MEVMADSGPGEGSLSQLQTATFSLCPHDRERENFSSSYEDTDPTCHEAPPTSPPNIIIVRGGLLHMSCWGIQAFSP